MNPPPCTLTILVARPDMPFLTHTVRHLVRTLQFPFHERILLIDTAPLPARCARQPGVGTLDELLAQCHELKAQGVIDRCLEIRHDDPKQRAIYDRHHAPTTRQTRDYRGCPSLGRVLGLEVPATDYVLHFDSDILLHCRPGFDWVNHGIRLLAENEDVMFVAPLPGPPTTDGALRPHSHDFRLDSRGFYRFPHFSSRKYLVDRRRLRALLPLRPRVASRKLWLRGLLRGESALEVWEVLMSQQLEQSKFCRADTSAPAAWTLHAPDHGAAFIEALPGLIERVERGEFPAAQAGDYDLRLDLWR